MPGLFGTSIRLASALSERPRAPARACGWPALDALLPGGGVPHAVTELACPSPSLAGPTRVAAAAVRAALERDGRAWCAWLDAESTLFAPGLASAGVDLARLLVVRPPRKELPRALVKVASSGAFEIVVAELGADPARRNDERLVRKLALAAEKHGSSILLLASPHRDPWPVALRLELARTREGLDVRVTKDRSGALPLGGSKKAHVPLATLGAR